MKRLYAIHTKYIFILFLLAFLSECTEKKHSEEHGLEEHQEHEDGVILTQNHFEMLGVNVDTLSMRNLSGYVEANGQLTVPPQNEAIVTTVLGANIASILVMEGDKVSKGQTLAYLYHPSLIELQSEYIDSRSQMRYLEKDYLRQKTLYEENVSSGKEFQKTEADYLSLKALVTGHEAQIKQLGMDPVKLQNGLIYEQIPLRSPIEGYIRAVNVKIGQYIAPETGIFEIVNNEHIHADLMIFEKDVHKVKQGQKVLFTVQSAPDTELEASIYAVGKTFEQNPKALHLHAQIENKQGFLIPGMYIRGRIIVEDIKNLALPEEAIVREGDRFLVFKAQRSHTDEWVFSPVEIIPGVKDHGWIEVNFPDNVEKGTSFAYNNAYYLLSEMKKSTLSHEH